MDNPFDDDDDAFKEERERWERERKERERLEQERREAEAQDGSEAEYEDAADLNEKEPEQLRLDEEEERLPWLESDDEDVEDVVDTARVAMVALLGLLAVLAIVGLAWWLSRDKPDAELLAEGSTIEAPDGAVRSRPDEPGGQPVEGTGDVSFEVSEGQDRETHMASAGATPEPLPGASASAVGSAAQPSIDREQASNPAQGNAQANTSSGGVGVQVGAYSSRATAETGWNQLTRQHSALQGVNHRIVQAEVDGNTVFRLQAVSANGGAAEQLCRAIKSGGGDCRVVN